MQKSIIILLFSLYVTLLYAKTNNIIPTNCQWSHWEQRLVALDLLASDMSSDVAMMKSASLTAGLTFCTAQN